MDKLVLKQILRDNQEEVERYVVFPRDVRLDKFPCYVLVGVRRAGKSYMLYHRIQQLLAEGHGWDEILYLNFEDERLENFTSEDFNRLLECHQEMYGKRPMLFLDEIQNIEGWEHFARRLADENYKVFVTGSNAHMLSREIASTLGGRFQIREIFPFSFGEYLKWHGVTLNKTWEYGSVRQIVRRLFEDYFYYGGISEVFPLKDKRGWLTTLYQKVLYSDVVMRNRIRNDQTLNLLVKKLADSVLQPTSVKRLQDILTGVGQK